MTRKLHNNYANSDFIIIDKSMKDTMLGGDTERYE